jgi:crotonobetainyl-CoA:carnitine CoA-transferase CaiB-like acyl-CoA transferase
MGGMMEEQALSDVRVLDLSQGIAGPYCAKLLANQGADVIKVEPPEGDVARTMGPFADDDPHPEKSGLFLHLNTSKKGITLNLGSEFGANALKELVKDADILIESSTPGTMEDLGLSHAELEKVNPKLVMTSITPFGQTGPYAQYKATELVAFAMSQRMSVHGAPEREPLQYAPGVPLYQAGLTAAGATMGALFAARLQGIGQQVDVAWVETWMGNVDQRILIYQYSGEPYLRLGPRTPGAYIAGTYPCKDGFWTFAASGDRYFRRLCRAMGRADLLEDERWATIANRPEHEGEFEAEFYPWVMELTRQEITDTMAEFRVMGAQVNYIEDLPEIPQLKSRGFFVDIDHPVAAISNTRAPLSKCKKLPGR